MIDVSELKFIYPQNKEATIKGLDFSINQGEIFGFLGPSGAGKSTTQRIIIGILKNYQGSVRVMGKELKDLDNDYYEKVGVSFEFPNLYSKFSALENLSFFSSLYTTKTEDPKELLKIVGLLQDANTKVADFSKGMKMRLNFCRALLNKPELIFLDEPTSGLDPVNAKKIKEIILAKKRAGKTIFITTHNMGVAEDICDRVAFIVDGKINLIDNPKRLKVEYGSKIVSLNYYDDGIKNREFDLTNLGQNEEFIRLIKEKEIETIHTQEASLEDIFIEVTGRSLI